MRPKVDPLGSSIGGLVARENVSPKRRRVSGGPTRGRNMSTQVVLITGGLSGIGRAAAIAFAKKGAKVVVAGRRDDAGKALVKKLRSLGSEADSSTPTSARTMTSALWSTRPSPGLAVSMSR